MRWLPALALTVLAATPARACETALLLLIDVSNSVDVAEYRIQTDGLADALIDPEIVEVMVREGAAIAVMQWSGTDRQAVSIPWRLVASISDAHDLSAQARLMPREFQLSDTAPAEAVMAALDLLQAAPACARQVIDISGDGTANAGSDVRDARAAAERAGVTINGIAIEGMGLAITNFFTRSVVTRNGFVMTARTHREYPQAIRAKILRELSRVLG